MVRRGLAPGRDEAKRLIGAGSVRVDGSSLVKPATMVTTAASISIEGDRPQWASRGGLKLSHALSIFKLDLAGRLALDVGASTGGFTDVLLDAGTAAVTAVDVGYGQMVWRLSQDKRVTVVDRSNFRNLDVSTLGGPFDVVVVDVSFISVSLLAENLAAAGRHGSDYVVLVKPQFEVGRGNVGRGGIVSDPQAHADAIRGIADSLATQGIGCLDLTTSPVRGAKGNREFLLHGRHGSPRVLSGVRIDEEASL